MNKIKVLVADDHPVVREGLSTILQSTDEFEVVGQARNGEEAILLAEKLRPNVVLMDIQMPKVEGIEATSQILQRCAHTEVVVISTFDQDEYIYRSIQAGAKGYVLKDSDIEELLDVIRAAARGHAMLPNKVATTLVGRISATQRGKHLTKREYTVLTFIAKGLRNKDIADKLNITERTVKNHVTNIISKFGVDNRTEALSYALRKGLIKLD